VVALAIALIESWERVGTHGARGDNVVEKPSGTAMDGLNESPAVVCWTRCSVATRQRTPSRSGD
jgi:hypothetical protein